MADPLQSAINNQQSKICVVAGDGVGKEVIPAAVEVLGSLGLGLEFVEADAGFERFQKSGNAIPDATLAEIESAGVAMFGATSSPTTGAVAGYRSPILAMRRAFDLYANLRPVRSLPGPFSRPNVDLLIVRENTEGMYAGRERRDGDTAIAERVITARGSERIARVAFAYARKLQISNLKSQTSNSKKQTVTVVHKANVLKVTDGLFRESCLKVAPEFPGVTVDEMLVDAMAMRLVRDPENFDVIVTTNLFGDILSDEAAALIGGLGIAPSANIGERAAVFEPVHGSAPDIAGQGIANPIGAILSAAMLLDHIGQGAAADRVRAAVNAVIVDRVWPRDLGGSATTREVTAAIIGNL
ncbi:MAG: isocitrate/isopropylmalate dehydrogenase family protein [Chloroflexi bacterium]|nr:isocitrate/isopropylmalate dehydrogenase family protein [Chloroflexota bacterium]